MSLYGAATTGVDPQTGSYLNKRQRIAMFQASRGAGGGGEASRETNKRVSNPQTAIVVANKMTAVVQQLQTTNQETIQAVNVKVEENRRNIENLYKAVEANRDAEADREKLETKDLRREREGTLRAARENIIEGLSSAVAGLAGLGRRAAEAALSPVMSIWDKIKQFLANILLAWAAFNADAIIEKIQEVVEWFQDLPRIIAESNNPIIKFFRDAFTSTTNILRWVGRLGAAALRVSGRILASAGRIVKRIFQPIFDITWKIVKGIVTKLKDIVKWAWNRIGNIVRSFTGGADDAAKSLTGVDDAVKAAASSGDDVAGAATGSPSQPRLPGSQGTGGGIFSRIRNWWSSATETAGNVTRSFTEGAQSALGRLQEVTTGIKPAGEAGHKNWLKKALDPVLTFIGNNFKNVSGVAGKVFGFIGDFLRRVPGVGFAIDLAINKGIAGQDWTEAIIRAMGSSLVGGLSAAAGAKAGAIAGGMLGAPIAGIGAIPGAAIGGILGALIAGMVGSYAGDQGAKALMEVGGLETTSNEEVEKNTSEAVNSFLESDLSSISIADVQVDVPDFITDIQNNAASLLEAIPGGMELSPEAQEGGTNVTVMEAEPIDVSGGQEQQQDQQQYPERAGSEPLWSTYDPFMDIYRNVAIQFYQLAT